MNPRTRRLAILISAAIALIYPATSGGSTREEYSKQECATCHITWLDAFRTKDETIVSEGWKPALIKDTIQVVTSEEMCYSCHDGFVRDSRQRVWEGKGHSVGKKPSRAFASPSPLPLNKQGEIYCGTCHSPHGVGEQKAELTGSVFLRVENTDSKLCLGCHGDRLNAQGMKNHPVGVMGGNPVDPEVRRLGGRLGSDPRKIICQSCHSPHGKGVLIKPADDSSLCLMCHADKGNSGSYIEARSPSHPVGIVPQRDIARAPVFKSGGRLGEQGRLTCLSCHGVHSGLNRSMVLYSDMSTFCQGCHDREAKIVSQGKHNLLKSAPHSRNVDGQTPAESGPCRGCHHAHGWAQKSPDGRDKVSTLCLSCHREGGAASKETIGPFSHPVDADIESLPQGSSLRLVRDGEKSKIYCVTCHDPHEDRLTAGQAPSSRKGDLSKTNRFLRRERLNLCEECHADHGTVRNTKHDMTRPPKNADPLVQERLYVWGPCGACHQIHNAKRRYLWAMDSPEIEGAGNEWCASCHVAGKCAQEKPLSRFNHPLPVVDDRKLPETFPLLTIDGSNGTARKLACHTCHDPHRWSEAGAPKDKSARKEGTGMDSFLRVPNDRCARLCVACHPDKEQVRGTDHDLPGSTEKKDGAGAGSLCSSCHLTHGQDPEKKLWSRGLGGKGCEIDRACLACHKSEGVAAKKAIKRSHYTGPVSPRIPSKVLPLSGPAPRDSAGLLTCATCHEPHRWEPLAEKRPGRVPGVQGKEQEGTGKDSFLRISSEEDSRLCSECHTDKSKVIGTDHDLRLTGAGLSPVDLASVRSGGVCSACHIPHNSMSERLLWARRPGTGSSDEEAMCFTCHEYGKMAGDKAPRRYAHADVDVRPAMRKTKAGSASLSITKAAFSQQGEGRMACFTCHDPHQWSTDPSLNLTGGNMEGDAGSSFLAKKSHEHACFVCHGKQSLYRYLYYHRPRQETPRP